MTRGLPRQPTLFWSAKDLINIQHQYAQNGLSISEVALCGSKNFVEWRHYPKNDLIDSKSGYEFYYHSHSADEMTTGEHGHFHLFKRDSKNPNKFFHLIGIALDQKGIPVRLFTTNQWVTGESLASARAIIKMLKDFNVRTQGRMAPLARWLSSFVRLFFIEIATLIQGRDQEIKRIKLELGSLSMALSSKNYHVLTECKINFIDHISKQLLTEAH